MRLISEVTGTIDLSSGGTFVDIDLGGANDSFENTLDVPLNVMLSVKFTTALIATNTISFRTLQGHSDTKFFSRILEPDPGKDSIVIGSGTENTTPIWQSSGALMSPVDVSPAAGDLHFLRLTCASDANAGADSATVSITTRIYDMDAVQFFRDSQITVTNSLLDVNVSEYAGSAATTTNSIPNVNTVSVGGATPASEPFTVDVVKISGDTSAANNLETQYETTGLIPKYALETTVAAGSTPSIIIMAAGNTVDDAYNGMGFILINSAVTRRIIDYDGGTRTVTLNGGIFGADIEGSAIAILTNYADPLATVNVVEVSGDATAADNLELQYDGTGLTGATFPSTQSAVNNIPVIATPPRLR